jgi:hypothetical protein
VAITTSAAPRSRSVRWVGGAILAVALIAACTSADPAVTIRSEHPLMVPIGSVSVLIRSSASPVTPFRPRHTRDLLTAGYVALVSKINAGVGKPYRKFCDGGGLARTYTLAFHYPTRPTVTVSIGPDCHPSINNGRGIRTDNLGQVVPTIRRLVGLPPGYS